MNSRLGALIGLLALSNPAFGHHSQAEFDDATVVELQGEIVAAYWRNPHVNFTLRTVDDDGNEELWEMEAASWNTLSRKGVPEDVFKAGDRVTIAAHPSTRRPRQLQVNHVLLASGMEVILSPSGDQPRWSNEYYGGTARTVEPAPLSESYATAAGLFQIWAIAGGRRVPLDRELPLTASAREALANWDPLTEDPLLQCVPPGMPPAMGNPYPMQFIEQDDKIVLHLEEFDNIRTIHLDPGDAPRTPAPLGYSVGRWEEDTLVIETTAINYPYFNRVGVAQSASVETFERFTVSEDGRRLDYELTITDPATLTEPVHWGTYFVSGRGEVIRPYECNVERYVERERRP